MAKSLTEAAKEILDASRGKNSEGMKKLDDPNASVDGTVNNLAPVSKNTPSGGEASNLTGAPSTDLGGETISKATPDTSNPDASVSVSKSQTKVNANADAGEGRKSLDSGNPSTPGQEGKGKLAPHYTRSESLEDNIKKELVEDLGGLLKEEGLSEEFKAKLLTIFEAAVVSRVNLVVEELEADFAAQIEEATDIIKSDLSKTTNDYLSYVVEEWMKENEIAIEKSLRSELTEDFISGLRQLFTEHYIDIPEDKVNIVEELTDEVANLEAKLNEEIAKNVKLNEEKKNFQVNETFAAVADGLTDVQVDKFKSLAEGVEFTTEGEYSEKLKLIRENYFSADEVKADKATDLNDPIVESDDAKAKVRSTDPTVSAIADAITRSVL